MRRLRASLVRVLGLFRRRQQEAEMNAELHAHLDELTERNTAKGMSPEEARLAAMRSFGGIAKVAEESRDQRRSLWLEQLGQDIHYACRQFRRSPGFTAIIVLTVALGIGANTAIFSVADVILFRPLNYPGGERLVLLSGSNPKTGERYLSVSASGFAYCQANAHSFEHLAAIRTWEATLTGEGDAEQLQGVRTSPSLFGALETQPTIGRLFDASEDTPGRNHVVVLSDSLWRRRFHGDPHVLGRSIMLNGDAYTIIGIMPPTFQFGREVGQLWEFWTPIALTSTELAPANWRSGNLSIIIGRLHRGRSLVAAQSELDLIAAQVRRQFLGGESNPEAANWGLSVDPVIEETVGHVRPILVLLLGAVALVLLIACANVANLLLARAATRGRELALRLSLGASRSRVVRQLLTESTVLAIAGGGLGVMLAHWSVPLLRYLAADRLPRGNEMGVDLRVLGFALAVSFLTGIVFGLAPAWRATRTSPAEMLKQDGRGFSSRVGLRSTLIVSEVALALVLLVGAGLLLKSFGRLLEIQPGFRGDHLLVARLAPPATKYRDARQLDEFFARVLEGVRALPGVEGAAFSTHLPMSGDNRTSTFEIAGRIPGSGEANAGGSRWHVGSGYFQVMGIPVLQGRGFDDRDQAESKRVVVIDDAMAQKYWPDQDPIGQRISLTFQSSPGGNPVWREIVGIVGHVKHDGLEYETPPQYYLPQRQVPERSVSLVVRTAIEPAAMIAAVRGAIGHVDGSVPLYQPTTMKQMMSFSLAPRQFALSLVGGFAILALGLAAIGLYGVISYIVTQRTREFGVRLALGASMRNILILVLARSLKLTVLGVILGLAGAIAASRLIRHLLFEVSPVDLGTFVAISLLLLLIATVACLIPARRAAKVDPMIALRTD